MTGSGFTAGAAMGFSIGGLGATPGPYDASATGGVTFWIKAAAPWVELQFPTSETVPVSDGACVLTALPRTTVRTILSSRSRARATSGSSTTSLTARFTRHSPSRTPTAT